MTLPGGTVAPTLVPVVLTGNTDQYSRSVQVAAAHTSKLSALVGDLEKHLEGLSGRAGRGLLRISGQEVTMLAAYTATAATFEKQLSTLRASAAVTGESFRGIKAGVESAFGKFPTSRTEVIQLTQDISELGVTGAKQISSLTQTFIKLGEATGEPMNQLASGLIQLSRLMGNQNATVIAHYANSLLVTSKAAGVSATGVTQFAQAIAPVARMAGIGETGVIGISTAFSKAGADGYVAANTFNSMISDMTNLMVTGSPELAKYSNLVGMTTSQFSLFAKSDAAGAFTKVIEAIAKQGPKGIDTLNRLGFEGVRTQAAITALAQSGDLQKSISTATAAAGGTGALDRGAKAATDNLVDTAAKTRNSMTQIATGIGTTLTGPLNASLKGVNALVGGFNKLFGSLGPIHGLITILITGFTAFAGVILVTAAAAGKLALASWALRSSPMQALRAGIRMGPREGPAPRFAPWAAPMYPLGRRIGSIPMQLRQELGTPRPGEPGWTAPPGFVMPAGGMPTAPWYQRAGGQALRFPIWLAQTQTQFLSEAARPGGERVAPFMAPAMRRVFQARERLTGVPPPEGMLNVPTERDRGWFSRMVGRGAGGGFFGGLRAGLGGFAAGFGGQGDVQAAMKDQMKATIALTKAQDAAAASISKDAIAQEAAKEKLVAAEAAAAKAAEALAAAEATAAKAVGAGAMGAGAGGELTATRQSGALVGALTRMWGTGAAGAMKTIGSAVAPLLGGALKMLFNPYMLALVTAPLIFGFAKSRMYQGNVAGSDVQAIQKYNDALGISTQQVTSFGSAAGGATQALLGTVTAATSMQQTAVFTPADALAAAGQKPSDTVLKSLAGTPGGTQNAAALAQLLQSYGITDPRALRLVQQQAGLSGFSPGTITAASQAFAKTQGAGPTAMPEYGDVAKQVMASEGIAKGWASPLGIAQKTSTSGQHVIQQLVTGQGLERDTNAQRFGEQFANLKRFGEQMDLLGSMAGDITQATKKKTQVQIRSIGETINAMIGGKTSDYQAALKQYTAAAGMPAGGPAIGGGKTLEQMSGQERSDAMVKVFTATTEGKNYLKGLGIDAGKPTPDAGKKLTDALTFGAGGAGAYTGLGKPIAEFVTKNKEFTDSLLSQDPTAAQKGLDSLGQMLIQTTGSLSGASTALEEIKASAGAANSAMYQTADAEQQIINARQQAQLPYQTRAEQGKYYQQQYTQAATELYQHPNTEQATQDEKDKFKAAQDALKGYQQQQQQTMVGMLQTITQFDNQMADQQKDFQTGQEHANRDYHNQQLRGARDFGLQMARMDRDFKLQTSRATRDFNTAMERETSQAAKDIYNPYQRIQAQFTDNAGTTLLLLKEQNQAITGQFADLRKASQLGLSQQAIDTLQLANPQNAQQLNTLVQSLTTDPQLVSQINAAVGTRVQATAQLVHSNFSEQFRNTTADFRKQMADAQTDINTARSDAQTAQANALTDMATDFKNATDDAAAAHKNAMDRAGRDLTNALKEWTGSMADVYANLMTEADTHLKGFSTGAYNTIVGQLKQLKINYPNLFETTPTGPGGSIPVGQSSYFRTPKGNVGMVMDDGSVRQVEGNALRDIQKSTLPLISSGGMYGKFNFAEGGISTRRQTATVSEHGPEVHLPMRGAATVGVFADIVQAVSRELGMAMHTAGRGVAGKAAVSIENMSIDKSTQFNGPICVQAADPDKMASQLQAKARIAKLANPAYKSGRS